MSELKQKLLDLQAARELIGEAEYKRREKELLDLHTGMPSAPAPSVGSAYDLSEFLGQGEVVIGPQNRQYRLERSLGKGSFGEVFLAEDVETSRQLGSKLMRAVKVLHKGLATEELSRRRLTRRRQVGGET